MSRRGALKLFLHATAGLAVADGFRTAAAQAPGTLALRRSGAAPVALAEEFTGLGYEMSSVAQIGLLSPDNHAGVELVRGLGEKGVIRAGGIVADYTRFAPQGNSVTDPRNTVLTEEALEQFGRFLRRVGWRAIWSLNFAQGSAQDAVSEAQAVNRVLGDHLLAFEMGNEVENYGRSSGQGRPPFRSGTWDYPTYLQQFRQWRAAIRGAVPGARFAAPDTASSLEWAEAMARDTAGELRGEVQLLTTHYYRAPQVEGTAAMLTGEDPRLDEVLRRMGAASAASHIPWRLCETNSFSGGGRPGVSDAMIGALWTLDTMLRVAASGCSGINLETGMNQLGFLSSYSPIRNDERGQASAGVPYYGMLAFAEARRRCTQILPVAFDAAGSAITAYALGRGGKAHAVVVINRDAAQEARVEVGDLKMGHLHTLRLSNAAVIADSQTGVRSSPVRFGDALVGDDGRWVAAATETVRDGLLRVPAMSAVVARSKESHRG